MDIVIIGLPQSGKTTLFNALTLGKSDTSGASGSPTEMHLGVVKVPDPRLEHLGVIYHPRKVVPAEIRYTDLPGPEPSFFFAPSQIQKRSQEWGPAVFQERLGGAWSRFRDASRAWLRVVHSRGPEAVERAYRRVLEGAAKPDEGHILSL